jgi:hypothetical protein
MEPARTPLTGHSAGHWLGVGGDSRWRRRVSIGWGLARGPAQGVSPSGQCGWPAASGHFVLPAEWRRLAEMEIAPSRGYMFSSRARPPAAACAPPAGPAFAFSHHHRRRRGTPTNPIPCVLRATPARSWRVCVYATHATWAPSPLSPCAPSPQPPGLILMCCVLLTISFK